MIRALVVDDEVNAREELAALLRETGAFEVVGLCANAVEAIPAVRRERPAVLFLDVQMPAISGFELLAMLDPEELPQVVFVTAHDEFAVRAFEENAVDYLLKPVERERLARTLERLRRGPSTRPATLAAASIRRIPCQGARSIKLVDLADVESVRSSEAGVYVVTGAGEHFTDLTLRVLEDRTGLFRCHKQHLVNVERVDEILLGDDEGAQVRTRTGRLVPVSRRFLGALKELLGV
ncbi:MAG: two-component system response regulator BtsR [Anaeromyxobacter sp.]|nr:two-component system response regulator BtsR [Anaeromyxobacter sp.]MBL0274649.1 two-component system response regulator BtsR [Anaeromyxobacter sp.]